MSAPAARLAAARSNPTLRDVARAAGTTPMTVSNVVNGRAGQVGPELRGRVMAACEQLGYRPHATARLLRTNRHMAVGVIIVDPSPHYLSDPFTAAMLAGLSDVFAAHGYAIVLHSASAEALADAPVVRRIASDGICLVLSGTPDERRALFERVRALEQPVVLIQDELPDESGDAASVIQDDADGARRIARHLFASPCRSVAMLVPALGWCAMERREAGVRFGMAEAGADVDLAVVRCADEGFEAAQAAFAAHCEAAGIPDVVIGGNDRLAIAAMKWLTARGMRVPDDVRVTGFNGLEFWRYATPELSTVHSPAFALGEEAARLLVRRLEDGVFPVRRVALPVEFAPHRSSLRGDGTDFQPGE
jgi:LacI family transcriptional regulator